jgi:glycosyltransferase involved in cell wall biosynthesis
VTTTWGYPANPRRGASVERDALRIVQVNAVYDRAAATATHLLDAYPTLCDLSDAMLEAGASVATVQRFHTASREVRGNAQYWLVCDHGPSTLPWWQSSSAVANAVHAWRPDVVHVHGLQFPALLRGLRSRLGPEVAIVVQDHAGQPPPVTAVIGDLRRWYWRRGLSAVDAYSFTAAEQAGPWQAAGFLPDRPVLAILEGSTRIRPQPRDGARSFTGMDGTPAILWVGRLTGNKDPMTVLTGLELALPHLPKAQVYFVYAAGDLVDTVRARLTASPVLRDRVRLVGAVPHGQIAAFFSGADLFISGSHREGSGYALLEALACGLLPVVTNIPSFAAIAGPHGRFWTAGDPASFASALRRAAADAHAGSAERRQHFDRALSWPAIAAHTRDAYAALLGRRREWAR